MISFFPPIYQNFLLAVAFSIKCWFSIYKPIYPCATVLYHSERRTISFLDFSDILIVETLEGFRFYISCCISALKKKRNRTKAEINARRVMFDILLVVIFRKTSFLFGFIQYQLLLFSDSFFNFVSCMHIRSSVLISQVYFLSQCVVIVNIWHMNKLRNDQTE